MAMDDAPRVEPGSVAGWHDWLAAHHRDGIGVWVVVPRNGATHLTYDDLIREALCWGWIDGQARPLDESRSLLWMTHRKPSSPWSASNKARVADLEAQGRLQPEGRRRDRAGEGRRTLDDVRLRRRPGGARRTGSSTRRRSRRPGDLGRIHRRHQEDGPEQDRDREEAGDESGPHRRLR